MNLISTGLISLAVIAVCALSYWFLDIPVLYLAVSIQGPVKDFFAAITFLGLSTGYLIASGAAFIWYRYVGKKPIFSNMALFVFCAIAVSGILNAVLKYVFGRYRPGMLLDHGLYGFRFFSTGYDYTSFPSGHANTVTALLLALCLISKRFGPASILIVPPLAMSRVVIGSHYLSDVIFGSYLAVVTTLFLREAFEKKGLSISWSPDRPPAGPEGAGPEGAGSEGAGPEGTP
ncbi:MAG: phosphatase PAP2 family protein [Syntrophobacteraceae bacterium]